MLCAACCAQLVACWTDLRRLAQFMAAGASVMSLRKALFGKAFKERPGVKALFEEHKKSSAGACARRCSGPAAS